jgi:hypothetical protein
MQGHLKLKEALKNPFSILLHKLETLLANHLFERLMQNTSLLTQGINTLLFKIEPEIKDRVGSQEWATQIVIGEVILSRVFKWAKKEIKDRAERIEMIREIASVIERKGYDIEI